MRYYFKQSNLPEEFSQDHFADPAHYHQYKELDPIRRDVFLKKLNHPRWGIFHAVLVFAICFAALTCLGAWLGLAIAFVRGLINMGGLDAAAIENFLMLPLVYIQSIMLILAPFLVARYYYLGRAWHSLGIKRPRFKDIAKGAGAALAAYPAVMLINLLVSAVAGETEGQDIMMALLNSAELWQTIGLVVGIVLIGPLSEEIFFRGFLFPAMNKRWSLFPSALFSGFLFSLVHFSIVVIISFTLLGMMLAYLYKKTGSLWASVACHAVFNGISVTLMLIYYA